MSITWVAGGHTSNTIASISYSTDGLTYTNSANAAAIFGSYVRGIAHNGSIWVAGGMPNGGTTSSIGYSYDAITWYASSSGKAILNNVNGLAYGNGKFVATGGGPTYMTMYSTDGINWTGTILNTTYNGYGMGVVYANSRWVVCGGAGTNKAIISSPDAITNWTLANTTALSYETRMIDYGASKWVAVGSNADGATRQMIYSSSSDITTSTWTNMYHSYGNRGNYVKWGGDRFIINGYNGSYIKYSTNGTTWTTVVDDTNFNILSGAINYNNGTWLMGQAGGFPLVYSTNGGLNWTRITVPNTYVVYAVAYALPPANKIGSVPAITSITPGNLSFKINFTPSTGGYPAPTTYYYSLDGGTTYTNANRTTSPITVTGLQIATTYKVSLIANSTLGNTAASSSTEVVLLPLF